MKLGDLLKNVNITGGSANMDMEISGVSYDSRTVGKGMLFVAIKGFTSDGHDFILQAIENGAACVLCEREPDAPVPYAVTENTRKNLAVVSSNWFENPSRKLRLIGVTGTNGKTTVTNLIKEILESCLGAKVGLIGTNRNMIGSEVIPAERTTPESYEIHGLLDKMVLAGCEYAVMEVSSHALYLDRVFGLQFDIGVFTNLTPDHLDFHQSIDDYAAAKARIFSQCREGAVNLDDNYSNTMLESAACPVFTYSIDDDSAELIAKSVKLRSDKVEFCALLIGTLQRIELGIPGKFSVYNALAAISAALLLGIDLECVAQALKTCSGVRGRAEIVPTGRDYTVIIDYAHTPDALENIIMAVRGFAKGKVVTLFGCGGDRDAKKRPLMGAIAAKLSDYVVVTSDNPRTEAPGAIIREIMAGMTDTKTPYQVIENRREAIFYALGMLRSGDVLILAGKGHEQYQIIGTEKTHFDEREVVAGYLERQPAKD